MFGYTDLYGGYSGGQAQYVRVPYANFGPRKVSDNLTDEQVLFLTDIFPTRYTGVMWGDLKGGETARKRAEGVILGRPVESKSSKTKLYGQEKKIQELIDKHVSYSAICRILCVHRLTVSAFVKDRMN